MGIGNVGGVIEVDEAFFRESFKGNHKKSTTFIMPRKPHKRGVKGRMKYTDLERLFTGRIEDESILCTDSHRSYIRFAKNSGIELQQIKSGKHIQHINAFHSKLKEWMYSFHSVSTKYLVNYMYWFKWLQLFSTEKDTAKIKHLLVQSHTSHSDIKLKDFKNREEIYI